MKKLSLPRLPIKHLAFSAITMSLLASLAGCGGGGGGGGSGSTPIQYTGSTSPAAVTTTTAGSLTSVVFGSNASVGMIAGVEKANGEANGQTSGGVVATLGRFGAVLQKTVAKRIGQSLGPRFVAGATINTTDSCDFGGTLRITGNVNDSTGLGTLAATFSNCNMGPATLNGPMTVSINSFDVVNLIPTDMSFSFTGLTMSGPGVNSASAGTIRMFLFSSGQVELISNIVTRDNTRSTTVKLENFMVSSTPVGDPLNPTQVNQTLAGRIYHSTFGYVDVNTQAFLATPVGISSEQLYPISGQLTLTGQAGANVRVTPQIGIRVRLQLDLDGNGSVDRNVELIWSDLAGPAGSDIGDDDGDNMTNGWEVFYGLNKNSPADAALDSDGDGFSNLVEHVSGSRPNSATSVPLDFDLRLIVAMIPASSAAPTQVTIRRTVENPSDTTAVGVVLTDVLPPGITPTSIQSVGGVACSSETVGSNAVVTCNVGTLAAFSTWVADITFDAAVPGQYDHSSTVRMDNPEANPTNNTIASQVTLF
jgi:uncharacterized repeat protein (TIGR01451 family)